MESIVCRNCVADRYSEAELKTMRGFWDRKFVDFDTREEVAICRNCGFERPLKRRGYNKTGKPNKSQQRAIDRIEHYFKDQRSWRVVDDKVVDCKPYYKIPELHRFEVEPTDHGTFWVSIQTHESWLITDGAHIHIGKRGAIEVYSHYGMQNEDHVKFLAKMLRGKVK